MLTRIIDRLEEWIIASLIAAATILIFFAVLHRYGSGASIDFAKWLTANGMPGLAAPFHAIFMFLAAQDVSWAQELCIYMFVWMAKFGAAYGVRTGIHVGVDVLVNRVSPQWRDRLVVVALLAGALFTGIIGSLGAYLIWHLAPDQTSEVLEWPMRYVYLAIPLGSYLMCFRFLQVMVNFLRTGELPKHDPGHVEGLDDEIAKAQEV